MAWNPTKEYRAKIGGIFFQDVEDPINFHGKPLISFSRNSDTNELGVSLELLSESGASVATIQNNVVTTSDPSEYQVVTRSRRSAVVGARNGIIWYEQIKQSNNADSEVSISALLITGTGYPIFLHPNRIRFGVPNTNAAPDMSRFSIDGSYFAGAAIQISDNVPFYMLSMGIRASAIGIRIADCRLARQ